MAFSSDQYDAALERQIARMVAEYAEPRNEVEPAQDVLANHKRDVRVTVKYAPTPGMRRASSTVVVTLADGTRTTRLATDFRASRKTDRHPHHLNRVAYSHKRITAADLPVADPNAAEG